MHAAHRTSSVVLVAALALGFTIPSTAQQQAPLDNCWIRMGPPNRPCERIAGPAGTCFAEVVGPGCYACDMAGLGQPNAAYVFVGCTVTFYGLNEAGDCARELGYQNSGCPGCQTWGATSSDCDNS